MKSYIILLLSMTLFFGCQIPNEVEPVEWEFSASIPIVRDSFNYGKLDFESGDFTVNDVDTISLEFSQSDSSIISLDDYYDFKGFDTTHIFKSIQLRGVDLVKNVISTKKYSIKGLPKDIVIEIVDTIIDTSSQEEPTIKWINFSGNSEPLKLTIHNTNKYTTIDTVIYNILDEKSNIITTTKIYNILPESKKLGLVSVTGKKILFDYKTDTKIYTTTTIKEINEDSISCSVILEADFNGTEITAGKMIDSIIKIDTMFSQPLVIESSDLDIEYIDIDSLSLDYYFKTDLGLDFNFSSNLSGKYKDLKTVNSIAKDSVISNFIVGSIDKSNNRTINGEVAISKLRIFPTREGLSDSINLSQFELNLDIKSNEKDGWVIFDSSQSIEIKIAPKKIISKGVKALILKDISFSLGTTITPITYPWSGSASDSLRGNIVFYDNTLSSNIDINITDSSYIDKFLINIEIDTYDENTPILYKEEASLKGNSLVDRFSFNMDSVINRLPDSLGIKSELIIPKDSKIMLHINDSIIIPNSSLSGGMKLFNINEYTINIPLKYSLLSRITLFTSGFIMPLSSVDIKTMLRDLQITSTLETFSTIAMNIQVYGVATDFQNSEELYNTPDSLISPSSTLLDSNSNIFPVFSSNEMLSIAYDDTSKSFMILDKKATDILKVADTILIRNRIILTPATDNITDTISFLSNDYVWLGATLKFEGIANTDSIIEVAR